MGESFMKVWLLIVTCCGLWASNPHDTEIVEREFINLRALVERLSEDNDKLKTQVDRISRENAQLAGRLSLLEQSLNVSTPTPILFLAASAVSGAQRPIPKIALGHEQAYRNFLASKLVYRPTTGSDVNMIELRVANLGDPLDDTFDLSKCGSVSQHLKVVTGLRTGYSPVDSNKLVVRICPHFVAVNFVQTDGDSVDTLCNTIAKWNGAKCPIGLFWTAGSSTASYRFVYATDSSPELMARKTLNELSRCNSGPNDPGLDYHFSSGEYYRKALTTNNHFTFVYGD